MSCREKGRRGFIPFGSLVALTLAARLYSVRQIYALYYLPVHLSYVTGSRPESGIALFA